MYFSAVLALSITPLFALSNPLLGLPITAPTGLLPTGLPASIPGGLLPTNLPGSLPGSLIPTGLPGSLPAGLIPTGLPASLPGSLVPTGLPVSFPGGLIPTGIPVTIPAIMPTPIATQVASAIGNLPISIPVNAPTGLPTPNSAPSPMISGLAIPPSTLLTNLLAAVDIIDIVTALLDPTSSMSGNEDISLPVGGLGGVGLDGELITTLLGLVVPLVSVVPSGVPAP